MKSLIIISLSGLLLMACNKQHEDHTTLSETKKVDTLKVLSLKRGKVEKQTSLPGELLAFEHVEIHPKVTGYIKQLKVDIGSVVKKGQILAVIDAPEIQSRLGEANGKLQASKAKFQTSLDTYNRIKDAAKTEGVVSPNELQKAKNQMLTDSADYNAARYSVASYQQVGNYLAITAPFNGIITQRNVNEGAYVGSPNEKPILVIEDNSKLRLRVAVPEALTGVSLKDNKVKFSAKSNPNQLFDALLMRKAGSIDANTRTEIWEFEVKNEKGNLKPGSFTNVVMNIFRAEDSYLVPFSTVVTTLEKKFVIKVTKDSTHWIDVSQGLNLSDKTEIFGSLKEGDTLVIKANEELKAKERVAIRFDK
ncbi:MAG: efflux RND transporter periplasmic adaptor subunit [Cyclobacteriaceae bacterium]|jgi:membrane fusion protein (multidrug efflux system)|nr:efflux RND transporter periplasmic adaptor subunit [Cyclobacteriaceae bacterium]